MLLSFRNLVNCFIALSQHTSLTIPSEHVNLRSLRKITTFGDYPTMREKKDKKAIINSRGKESDKPTPTTRLEGPNIIRTFV